MRLLKIRGFQGASIRFDFPVTALIGPNGAGKTTVLGAAGLIYRDVQPRRFFAKSGSYDDSMRDWKIEYNVLDSPGKSDKPGSMLTRTASYLKAKWNRDALERSVQIIGINRTLPASERKDLYKFLGAEFRGIAETQLSDPVVKAVRRILGKSASNYLSVRADRGKTEIFALRDSGDSSGNYSEFHFGAGEASIIRIVTQIEAAPANCLILIEEIENGLHPVATMKLVEYLIDVALRKSCQVIFTTHSNAALAPLPEIAVWACFRGELNQGKLDVEALRVLTGEVDCELAIFTEDRFGELLADLTLRFLTPKHNIKRRSIEIYAMGGAAQVRDHVRFHRNNPSVGFPAIGFLDGDQREADGFEPEVLQFGERSGHDLVFGPGDSHPEAAIFEDVASNLETGARVLGKLTQRLMLNTESQERVKESIITRLNTNQDPHLLFAQVGDDLDFLPADSVAQAFITIWADAFPEKVDEMWKEALPLLPS